MAQLTSQPEESQPRMGEGCRQRYDSAMWFRCLLIFVAASSLRTRCPLAVSSPSFAEAEMPTFESRYIADPSNTSWEIP